MNETMMTYAEGDMEGTREAVVYSAPSIPIRQI
jgi:hypothetical protein